MRITKNETSFATYHFHELFGSLWINGLIEESEKFPYTQLNGKRIDKDGSRIWMHQYDYDTYKNVCNFFKDLETKKFFGEITGQDYLNLKTRIELCKDTEGSWLEEHTDDIAKKFTLQLYLSDTNVSTVFDNTSSSATKNSGWFFSNTGKEKHGLPPLQNDRISIIVNYVDENWVDSSVLVEG